MADGIDNVAVYHRSSGDVVELGKRRHLAGMGENIAPCRFAVPGTRSAGNFTRSVGRDHDAAGNRRAGAL